MFGHPHKLGCREHEYLIRLVMLFLIVVEKNPQRSKPNMPTTTKSAVPEEKSRLERNFCLQMFNKTAESWFTFSCLCQTRCGWNWIENFVIAAENYVIDRKLIQLLFMRMRVGREMNGKFRTFSNRPIVSSSLCSTVKGNANLCSFVLPGVFALQ